MLGAWPGEGQYGGGTWAGPERGLGGRGLSTGVGSPESSTQTPQDIHLR